MKSQHSNANKVANIKIRNEKIKNLELTQIEQDTINYFLKSNPYFVYNKMGGYAYFFNNEFWMPKLKPIKQRLGISWNDLFSLINFIKFNN